MRAKIFTVIFAAVLIVCGAASLYIMKHKTPASIVLIKSDGKVVRRIDLKAVTRPYEFEVKAEYGYNRIYIDGDGIRITDADCPDKICIRHGVLKSNFSPIVCLPHKLTVIFENADGNIDAVTD